MSIPRFIRGQLTSLTSIGFVFGTLSFSAALTPTLVPRSYLTQGVLAGACFAIGYGLGVFLQWLWRYLELPEPQARMRQAAISLVAVFCLSVAILFLWWSEEWQNSVRAVMGMEPVASANPEGVSCCPGNVCHAARCRAAVQGHNLLVVVYIRRYVPKRSRTW